LFALQRRIPLPAHCFLLDIRCRSAGIQPVWLPDQPTSRFPLLRNHGHISFSLKSHFRQYGLSAPNAPAMLRALSEKQASRQLQPVVRFPEYILLLVHVSSVPNSKDYYVFVQNDVDHSIVTDTILPEPGERSLQGWERFGVNLAGALSYALLITEGFSKKNPFG
jgi:hypothetical protein